MTTDELVIKAVKRVSCTFAKIEAILEDPKYTNHENEEIRELFTQSKVEFLQAQGLREIVRLLSTTP